MSTDADRTRFDLLVADYESLREDERSFNSTSAVSISIAAALLGAIAVAITQTCAVNRTSSCVSPPGLFLAGAPLAPVAIAAYMIISSSVATVRSYYMRAVEQELRAYAPAAFPNMATIGPASYATLITELTSMRRGRFSYRVLANFCVGTVLVVFGGLTIYIGSVVSVRDRVLMAVVYVPIVSLMIYEFISSTVGGRSLFIGLAQRLAQTGPTLPQVPESAAPEQRSLASYLLVPRPADWIKWIIAPAVFLVASAGAGTLRRWPEFLTLWLVLEYLVYAARYQWNDLRGLSQDQSHVARRSRGRLPVGANPTQTRRNVAASLVTLLARLVAAAVVGVLVGHLWPTVTLLVLVFSAAFGYEFLRGRPSATPAHPTGSVAAIWILVGVGYAYRAGLGVWLSDIPLGSVAGIACLLCFMAFGIMFVLLTWVLEAASLARIDDQNRWRETAALREKPHVYALLRYVEIRPAGPDPAPGEGRSGENERVAELRGELYAPWNLALVAAAALGGVLGLGLANGPSVPAWAGLTAVAVSLLFAGAVALAPASGVRFVAILVGIGALCAVMYTFSVPGPVVAVTPFAVITVCCALFRASSYHDLNHPAETPLRVSIAAGLKALHWVVGAQTWEAADYDAATGQWARRHGVTLPMAREGASINPPSGNGAAGAVQSPLAATDGRL